jgi:hypothetical protein
VMKMRAMYLLSPSFHIFQESGPRSGRSFCWVY